MARGLDLILRLDYAPVTLKGGKYWMLKRGNGQEPILLMWAPGYHQTEQKESDSADRKSVV